MTLPKPALRRCAVYTRKSSEEGLEQEFNSLHAQREACEAFIRSQASEGWKLVVAAYDDGGLSGGTMERPALQRLMADIEAGKIDTIVVYKVDRLTRSLADFAKMVELFDAHDVSFVAVTQHFNTTTSMGRLTLNILLSFAQFEREVTGERIRDKIAASKKKGMWMGGNAPLGYDVLDKKLVPNQIEAKTVIHIYQRYLAQGCVRKLKADLDRTSITAKQRVSQVGRVSGGGNFSRGALYALLANPVYIGEISHKGTRYPGQHEAILEKALWDAVQAQLNGNTSGSSQAHTSVTSSPLAGKLFDDGNQRLTPTHANKKGRRYRYYVSQALLTGTREEHSDGWRIPADAIERVVFDGIAALLGDRHGLANAIRDAGLPVERLPAIFSAAAHLHKSEATVETRQRIIAAIERIHLQDTGITISLAANLLLPSTETDQTLEHHLPICIKRRGQEMRIVIEGPGTKPLDQNPGLMTAIRRARNWFDDLTNANQSLAEIAEEAGVSKGYVSRMMPIAFLAPRIVEAIVMGTPPHGLTADVLSNHTDLPIAWDEQERLFVRPDGLSSRHHSQAAPVNHYWGLIYSTIAIASFTGNSATERNGQD